MKRLKIYPWLVLLLMAVSFGVAAQSPGSTNTENSLRYVGGTRTSLVETLYIGPDARITVDGVWHIYSKNVWISPLAEISGNGTIVFHNSDEVGGAGGPTMIDGNNNIFIDVNIEHANDEGMQIAHLPLAGDLLLSGWTDNTSESTLKIGKDFNMSVDGADVWLGAGTGVTGDFVFDEDATISNYRPERMVITNNSIQSHMVKHGAASGFTFPIGLADGDYTPAHITGTGVYHASVQNYTASASNEAVSLNGGPDRTWHIYADAPGTVTVALQHNEATDTSPFVSGNPHFVTQYNGSTWSENTEEAGLPGTFTTGTSPIANASTQDLAGVAIPGVSSAPGSYLTKANLETTLPVTLVAFTAVASERNVMLSWTSTEEVNSDRFEIERSNNAQDWRTMGTVAASGDTKTGDTYHFIDAVPQNGTNYYRLKMIDKDATFTYSRIESALMEITGIALKLYPNPVNEVFYIGDENDNQLTTEDIQEVSVMDVGGVEMLNTSDVASVLINGLDISRLPGGVYLVKVKLSVGKMITKKLIVSK